MLKKLRNQMFSLLEKILPYDIYKRIRIFYFKLVTNDRKQKYKLAYFQSQNKKCEKKYCIFRFVMPNQMLFSVAKQYIFMYEWAVSKGFIPIVDIEYAYDFERGRLGENNLWELCFEQPLSVKEALKQDYVLVEAFGGYENWIQKTCLDINGAKNEHWVQVRQEGWRDYYANVHTYIEKCWKFKADILEAFEKNYGQRLKESGKVMGVFLREEFSEEACRLWQNATTKAVYQQHPMPPGVKETIEIVKEYMNKWQCDTIFLSTMYQESLDLFRQGFGDCVIYADRIREKLHPEKLPNPKEDFRIMTNKEAYDFLKKDLENMRERTVKYTEEVITLSRCDYLIAAKGGGAVAALTLNGGKYEDVLVLPDANGIERY